MVSHPTESLQAGVLRAYTTLVQIRSDWGGALVLSLGLSPAGITLPIASNIAGAVSLSIDQNPDHIRNVVRSGAVDFVVHSLDEAVRAMKNEIRKHAPLSVALNAPPIETLKEIHARGLAPQLFANFLPFEPRILTAAESFRAWGSELVDFAAESTSGFRQSTAILDALVATRSWQLQRYVFPSSGELRDFDALALRSLPQGDRLRRRWLEAAPRILQRQRPPERCLWLSPSERDLLSASVKRSHQVNATNEST